MSSRPLALATLAVSLASCTSTASTAAQSQSATQPPIDPAVAQELARHGIHVSGPVRELTETLPTDLMAGAVWGTKVGVCRSGGYDLSLAAGHRVRVLRYPIAEQIRGEPLYAFVVMDGSRIACVFRSVREQSEMAPGVFPASGARGGNG